MNKSWPAKVGFDSSALQSEAYSLNTLQQIMMKMTNYEQPTMPFKAATAGFSTSIGPTLRPATAATSSPEPKLAS